ncbi:hypothetical protein MTO96_030835 [Rhipicephalus appendiculatus]
MSYHARYHRAQLPALMAHRPRAGAQRYASYLPYLLGRSFPSLDELARFARQVAESVFWQHHYDPPPHPDVPLDPACASTTNSASRLHDHLVDSFPALAIDYYDGKKVVRKSQRGDKEIGEFWQAEAEVAEEGRAEENTGGDDGAGGWEAAAGGADGEAEEDTEEVEYYEAGTARDGEWDEKTKCVDAGDADNDDYVNDATGAEDEKTECVDADNAEVVDDVNDAAGAEEKPVEEASDNKAENSEKSENFILRCIQLQIHGQHEQRHLQYRRNLIQQLVGDVRAGARKRGPSARNDCEERLDGRSHFIYKLPGRSTKDCALCSDRQTKGGRRETVFFCKTCSNNPGLHPGECFERYHTLPKYR